MSERHVLMGRKEEELLWFQRRSFLKAAAAWTAMGGFAAAWAQQRSNVVELRGDATVNGERLREGQFIQTGDQVQTGPDSHLIFVVGNSAFQVRQNSRFTVDRGPTLNAVAALRMLTGAIVSVWGKGSQRQIITPTLTAGIRGTGVYTEIFPERSYRSYFCNCYGVVDMSAGGDRTVSTADYHQSFWGEPAPVNGKLLTPARAINHTDEEVEALAKLVGQRTAWEIAGKKGTKDGSGYMDPQPGQMHPLMRDQPAAPQAPASAPRQ
ncbi:twin-arginine translocation signal domain-containing protein [Ramlibacter albus]|uniref:Twin-arginine translocation signal domain-containing protein n=1 Tax=Ramlibacter albus TaxID=2079448 RepID=A0A923MD19_9BURK|nr:twin-arginine translocation signal domain-containing protein [Ramlibacter albus]MBC5766817.1 twin-arginine translocation signal domain-containing protein [Ramlibacter albus]